MSTIRKTLIGTGATLLAAASLASATPAFAATVPFLGTNQPNVVTAPQGSTTTLDWTIQNTGAPTEYAPGSTNGTITFNAPTGTTFPAQSTVRTLYSTDGVTYGPNNVVLDQCTTGSGGTTLTCVWEATGANGGPSSWSAGTFFRFTPTVEVSSTATPGTYSAAASAITPVNSDPRAWLVAQDITYGTLDIQIAASPATPLIDPAVGGGAAAAIGIAGGLWLIRNRRKQAATKA